MIGTGPSRSNVNLAGVRHPTTRVELMLSARNLKDKDVFSKSDPMCVVYHEVTYADSSPRWQELGRTETCWNTLNPQWNRKFEMEYFFETQQRLKFEIYDIDERHSVDLTKQDFLGRCECQLSDIVTSPAGVLAMSLKDEPNQRGELIVRAEEVDEGQKEVVLIRINARDLAVRRLCFCWSRVDVFIEIWRLYPNGRHQMVHRTEVVRYGSQGASWRAFEITVRHLCEGDKDRDFLVQCFEYKFNGSHKLIGESMASVTGLESHSGGQLDLTKKHPRRNDTIIRHRGVLQFITFDVRREYTWLDYLSGGLKLDFAVVVDFTASNGPVHLPTSLHYIDPNHLNQYEMAIQAILEVIEHYNTSKKFEALGFGAQIPPNNVFSNLFPLELKTKQTWVDGIQGVMNAYKVALRNTKLWGPTNFEPTIRAYLNKCQQMPKDGSIYQILLIITDGVISDLARTTHAIIDASDQPLSIIIIGVGNEDFKRMDFLDSDIHPLTMDGNISDGRVTKRDIVQFVPFRDYYGAIGGAINKKVTPQAQENIRSQLAKAVLEEVPYQITSWAKSCGIVPRITATGTQRRSMD